ARSAWNSAVMAIRMPRRWPTMPMCDKWWIGASAEVVAYRLDWNVLTYRDCVRRSFVKRGVCKMRLSPWFSVVIASVVALSACGRAAEPPAQTTVDALTAEVTPALPEPPGADSESETATIARDEWGVPHIHAETEEGAAYALGYAMAEDRL